MLRVLLAVAVLLAGPQGGSKPIAPEQAAQHVGEAVTVQGRVTGVTVSQKSHTTFITFGPAYPGQTFTAVIFESAQERFPNVKAVLGKTVLVHGTVRLYKQKPEIILDSAEQLNVVV